MFTTCVLALLLGLLIAMFAFVLIYHLFAGGRAIAALQAMAGKSDATDSFAQVTTFLNHLRASLVPIAIPFGGIGLIAAGALFMAGQQMAQRVAGGVVIGIALVMLAPSIMQ